ncbi:MAG: hypothetical protein ACLFS5_12680, partial [Spirochaetaceae bacterium]
LGAVYGLERIMGRADNPVRQVLNYASEHFAGELPIVYVFTVVAADSSGRLHVRGFLSAMGSTGSSEPTDTPVHHESWIP